MRIDPLSVKNPLIGITTYGRNDEGSFTLPAEYVECVRRAGGNAVLLPPGEPDPAHWTMDLDGIVFCGGGDIAPERFGGTTSAISRTVDAERDETEFALARAVLDVGLPSLWICRGMQLLNVVLGGTLIEHLPGAPRAPGFSGVTVGHDLPPHEPLPHMLQVDAESRLATTLGLTPDSGDIEAVSWHHQAIDNLGDGLRVVARAADGVIEAVELEDAAWCEAVQWHPELSAATDPVQQRLFEALLSRASASL